MISTRSIVKVILVAAGVLAALYLLYRVRQIVGLVFISIFLAVAMGRSVDLLQRRARLPRPLAILAVYLAIFLALFGVGLIVVPPVVDGVNAFVRDVPTYFEEIRRSATLREYDDRYQITAQLRQQAATLPGRLGDAAAVLQSVTVGVFSVIFQLITVLVMTFFFLLEARRIVDFGFARVHPERQQRVRAIAANVYGAVGGYVTGALAIALVAGLSTYVMLLIIGMPFAVPLAVVMAFFVLIPLVGATIGGAIIAVVAAFEGTTPLIAWAVFFLVYQQVENHVLQPFVYRRTLALHPLAVIIALLIGASLLGVLGALLAIPGAAAVQILLKDWWAFRGDPPADGARRPQPPDEAPRPEPPEDARGRPSTPSGEPLPSSPSDSAPPRSEATSPRPARRVRRRLDG